LLVPLAGANFVFALKAACFLLVVVATRQGTQPVPAKLPSESFFESFATINRYVRNEPRFQIGVGPKFPVYSVHFSDLGIDAGGGLESLTAQFV
jgi:hypothetical protein